MIQVPAHSELMWILSCTASVGYLSRMTQWKVRMLPELTETKVGFLLHALTPMLAKTRPRTKFTHGGPAG